MKRTRKAKGFTIHLPHLRIEDAVYHIYIKNPSITIEKVKDVPSRGGDKEGDSSDPDE